MSDEPSAAPHIASQQEKLDAIFGITGGKSVDEFLDSLTLEDNSTSAVLSNLNQHMQDKLVELSSMDVQIKDDGTAVQLQMQSTDHSLKEIEELVSLSKDVIKHVAQSILATPLIDSEAVQAYSSLMECIRINIAEFIGVYRDKTNFINKVKFEMFKHQQDKDMALYKHNLALERMKAKDGPPAIDAESRTSSQPWSQEQITKILNDNDMSKQ